MADTAQIINIADHRVTNSAGSVPVIDRHIPARMVVQGEVTVRHQDEQDHTREVSLEDLYGDSGSSSSYLQRADELLADCERRANEAQALLVDEDLLGADEAMTHIQANLPELFICKLSDGFDAAVLALYYSLVNMRGTPLNSDQIYAVRLTVERLRREPFLHFDKALDQIELLQHADLNTDPPEAAVLDAVLID